MDLLMAHPRRSPDSAFRQIGDGGGLVVLAGRAEVKVLNPVGIAIFSLLDGSRDVETLAAAVADDFDVDLDRAREEVRMFLIELQSAGLLADETPQDGRSS